MTPAFTLTVDALRALIREAVRDELAALREPEARKVLTDEDVALARKGLRRFGRGR